MQAMAEIQGLTPMLMHNCTGLDARHPLKKEASAITAKRGQKKTDSDLEKLDWIDFQLSAYHNGEGLFIPGENIHAVIREGAKAARKGKDVQSAIQIIEEEIPLVYDGPSDLKTLYEKGFADRRRVVVKGSAIIRTRARINTWGLSFSLYIDETIIDPASVRKALEYAGARVGLGDFRPRFGRFKVTGWETVK